MIYTSSVTVSANYDGNYTCVDTGSDASCSVGYTAKGVGTDTLIMHASAECTGGERPSATDKAWSACFGALIAGFAFLDDSGEDDPYLSTNTSVTYGGNEVINGWAEADCYWGDFAPPELSNCGQT